MWCTGVFRNKVVNTTDSGCLKLSKSETAVLSVHNDLVRSTNNGQVSALILLDFSSAFDTVDH